MAHYRDQLDPGDFDTPDEFAQAQKRAVPRPKTNCLRCGHTMTWAEQRAQYGRLMRLGFSANAAKQLLPRCQTCMTVTLRFVSPFP